MTQSSRLPKSHRLKFRPVKTGIRFSLLAACLFLALPPVAGAFDVEVDSVGNRLYVIIANPNPTTSLDQIGITVTWPAEVSSPTIVYSPNLVPSMSSAIAGFSFDVGSAGLGSLGPIELDLSGQSGLVAIAVPLDVALDAVAIAPSVQQPVGGVGSAPGIQSLDTDGDGVTDLEEIERGYDPFDASSVPPALVMVPSLPPWAIACLAIVFIASGWVLRRRQHAR